MFTGAKAGAEIGAALKQAGSKTLATTSSSIPYDCCYNLILYS